MKIAILNFRDMSGNGYNLAESINRLTKHEALNIRLQNNHFDYRTHEEPKKCVGGFSNITFNDLSSLKKIQKIIYDSNVIVVREFYELFSWLQLDLEEIKRKQIIVTFGGWRFRNVEWRKKTFNYFNSYPHVKWMTTSGDFVKDFPEATFVPCCLPMDEYRSKYDYAKLNPPLIIHTPSHALAFKESNEAFGYAVEKLANDYKFDADIIFGKTNVECLKLKAPASIFFDRLEYLYGVNSIEAACFESSVITNTSDETLSELEEHAGMKCPFVIVEDKEQLCVALETLLKDSNDHGKRCYQYAKKLHDGRHSVKQFLEMVE